MVVLTGYFDASGTHKGSETVVVAGFLGLARHWVDFSARWQLALNDFGIDHFPMTDFANKAPPYHDWKEPERRTRLALLLAIITESAIGSVGIVVDRSAFDQMVSPRARVVCGDAFGMTATALFMEVGGLLDEIASPEDRVSYVFDQGSPGAGTVLRIFQHNMRDAEQRAQLRLIGLRFEDKKLLLPLQAADSLAYELYKDTPRRFGRGLRPQRFPLKELATIPWRWMGMTDENIQMFSDVLSVRAKAEDSGELKPL